MYGSMWSSSTHRAIVRLGYCLIIVALFAPAVPVASSDSAYVEPLLQNSVAPNVSVIVKGSSSAEVAAIIQRIGGVVTDDLWLINSVGASVPTTELDLLAHQPGVQSVFANRSINSADEAFDGWVTPRRISDGAIQLIGELESLPAALPAPDGGIVTVSQPGTLQILNSDGSERKKVPLPKGSYPFSPLVDSSGNIYVVGNKTRIYALTPSGSWRWDYDHPKKITSVALNESTSTLYVGDEKGRVIALDVANDAKSHWRSSAIDGSVTNIFVTDQSRGTTIFVTDKGFVVALDEQGKQIWVHRQAEAAPFHAVTLSVEQGLFYILGCNRWLYALNSSGKVEFRRRMQEVIAQPALAADGSLFVGAKNGTLTAISSDGTPRFEISLGDQPITTLFLSPAEQVVYALTKRQKLFAIDTSSGAQQWLYNADFGANAHATVELDGNIHLIDESGNYTVLNPLGVALSKFDVEELDHLIPVFGSDVRRRVYLASEDKLFSFARMRDTWAGQPDAARTEVPDIWQLANPIVIDVGADMLHSPQLPHMAPITGAGVTVAVVDSGVQFTEFQQQNYMGRMQTQFLGQADFVQEGCAIVDGTMHGQQEDGYCFQDAMYSSDAFGHGSHVAGIIWNQFQDKATGTHMGVAPDANLLSIRILDSNGRGTYVDAIQGIQYAVANQHRFNIRVINLSISALAVTPYFVDPLNQAVERAWANGIVVVTAAGNEGPNPSSITVPGNDPYIITVGAINSERTPGYWKGDTLPTWSATGPTQDGFIKPDVLAPGAHIVSTVPESAKISQDNPGNRVAPGLFRMSGTSMATAVTSGVVALMLQASPALVPDQVKFRLAHSARPAVTVEGFPVHTILQQGMGRVWAPTAVLGDFPDNDFANQGMDIESDLAHGWIANEDLSYHYQGAVERLVSDDGKVVLFVVRTGETVQALGAANKETNTWLSWEEIGADGPMPVMIADEPEISWAGGLALPAGMATWAGGMATWAGGMATWAGGMATWAGGMATWAGGMATWAGGMATWAGGMATWAGGMATWAGGMATWAGGINAEESILASTTWVNDDGTTSEFQGSTVLNPVPDEPDSQPSPIDDLGNVRVYLPAVAR